MPSGASKATSTGVTQDSALSLSLRNEGEIKTHERNKFTTIYKYIKLFNVNASSKKKHNLSQPASPGAVKGA